MPEPTIHPNWTEGAPTVGRIVHYYPAHEEGCRAALVVQGIAPHTQHGDPEAKFRARIFYPDGREETLSFFVSSDFWHWPRHVTHAGNNARSCG